MGLTESNLFTIHSNIYLFIELKQFIDVSAELNSLMYVCRLFVYNYKRNHWLCIFKTLRKFIFQMNRMIRYNQKLDLKMNYYMLKKEPDF